MSSETRIIARLEAGGFLPPGSGARLTPLTGGVSSDVFRLERPEGTVCVKAALPKLRVAADWTAPVERSAYEVAWLRTARPLLGDAVPQVLYADPDAHLFVMNFYPPDAHPVWKSELSEGRVDVGFAAEVGGLLARVHAGTAGRPDVAAQFETTDLFEDLRLSPFLRHCAERHPDLAGRLVPLADRTAAARIALVHGDASPKNILCGPGGPVLLDAECAWYGDPAFDLAFCSAHLLLKTVWKPAFAPEFLAALAALREAYLAGVAWEPAGAADARAAELCAAILLARVDGKSPADYLKTPEDQGFVREAARDLIRDSSLTGEGLAAAWARRLGTR